MLSHFMEPSANKYRLNWKQCLFECLLLESIHLEPEVLCRLLLFRKQFVVPRTGRPWLQLPRPGIEFFSCACVYIGNKCPLFRALHGVGSYAIKKHPIQIDKMLC